jgi:hypothetical protein
VTAGTDLEPLLMRIYMVELQRSDPAAVSAEDTDPSCLLHQLLLDLSPSPGDGIRSTSLASVMAPPLQHELRGAMPLAVENGRLRSVANALSRPAAMQWLNSVASQPVPDR